MYGDSVIVQRKLAASHCCLYKFSSKHSPIKSNPSLTDQNGELSKYSEQPLTSFSVFEI